MTTQTKAHEPHPILTVRSCKYDGREHRRWRAQLVTRDEGLIVLDGQFEHEVQHSILGTIRPGTLSHEYFWLDRWYSVFRFHEPTGELRNYYCNINMPPQLDGDVLTFIDLDVDLLVAPDLSYTVLDEEEFEANAARFNYPAEVRRRASRACEELFELIETGRFPFVTHL